MKVLISAVGTTDPITNRKDGPLLHIARVYRPDKIILIYSEEMLEKEADIVFSLRSIEGYRPIIEKAQPIIHNKDVYIFDKMFEQLSHIIEAYKNDEDEFIFNLSSATPQIESAFFTINRISDFNTQAIQVATPARASNSRFQPPVLPSIEERIITNIDNQANFEDRTLKDQAENFNKALTKRTLRELIKNYDYQAAYGILSLKENKNLVSRTKRKLLNTLLEKLANSFRQQEILDGLVASNLSLSQQRALTVYLIADVALKRGIVTDFLIKSKTLAEFILEKYLEETCGIVEKVNNFPYLKKEHPLTEDILDYIAEQFQYEQEKRGQYDPERPYNREQYLNLNSYINIMEYLIARSQLLTSNGQSKKNSNLSIKSLTSDNYLEVISELVSDNRLLDALDKVKSINGARNKVAHGLEEIDRDTIRKLRRVREALKYLLLTLFDLEDSFFNYFEEKNNNLLTLLA